MDLWGLASANWDDDHTKRIVFYYSISPPPKDDRRHRYCQRVCVAVADQANHGTVTASARQCANKRHEV